jgi:hypothetical protein
MASTINNSAWLQWMTALMGGVSRQTYVATLPPDRFYCVLDEMPLHLIPQHVHRSMPVPGRYERLFLNPECVLCSAGRLPDELEPRRELVSGFALQGPMVWVRSSATGNLLPFWLSPQLGAVLRELHPNEVVPDTAPDSTRRLLAAVDILVPEERNRQRVLQREQSLLRAREIFRQKGYAPLGDLIHPFHIAALRRYYRHLIRTGGIHLGDGQSPRRYIAHNDPVARFFHHDIAASLNVVADEAIKPSYVYMASYLSGAELKKHTDRAQCEFSVTLCVDYAPEPTLESPWPIQLDTADGTVTVYQALGDGLAYRGTRLPHYRSKLKEGHTSTSIFFHYVGADFAGSLD